MLDIEFASIDNRTSTQLVNAILSTIQTVCVDENGDPIFTEIGPNSTLYQLVRAMVVNIEELKYTAEQTIQGLKQTHMKLMGLQRYESSSATCSLTFTLIESLGIPFTIPTGTIVRTLNNPIRYYQTTEDGDIAAGETEITVDAISNTPGINARVDAGELTVLYTPLAYVSSVTNTASVGGTDAESVTSALTRFQGVLHSQDRAVDPESWEDLAEQVQGVYKAKCWPITKYESPASISPGCTTLIIYPTDDEQGDLTTEVEAELRGKLVVGGEVRIEMATEVVINVTAKIKYDSGTTLSALTELATPILQEYFKEFDPYSSLTISGIRSKMLSVDGIHTCTIVLPEDDINLGQFGRFKLGVLTLQEW